MSDNPNITRDDLIAVGYAVYVALHDTLNNAPLEQFEFAANCKKYFNDFMDVSNE